MYDSKHRCPKCGNKSLDWDFAIEDTCKCGTCTDNDSVEYICRTNGCGFWFRSPPGKEKSRHFSWKDKDGEQNTHRWYGITPRSDKPPVDGRCPDCQAPIRSEWRCKGHGSSPVIHYLTNRCANGTYYYQCEGLDCGWWYIEPDYKERYDGELGFRALLHYKGETTHHAYHETVAMADIPSWANEREIPTA